MNKNETHDHHCCGGCGCHNDGDKQKNNCNHSHKDHELIISKAEKSILLELLKYNYLPVSRFVMCSSIEDDARFIALAPVYINELSDSMETVKEMGAVLSGLHKKNLISLDYDIPLQGYDYTKHLNSELYSYFKQTINEGKNNPNSLCDTAELETGSIALTDLGYRVAEYVNTDIQSDI